MAPLEIFSKRFLQPAPWKCIMQFLSQIFGWQHSFEMDFSVLLQEVPRSSPLGVLIKNGLDSTFHWILHQHVKALLKNFSSPQLFASSFFSIDYPTCINVKPRSVRQIMVKYEHLINVDILKRLKNTLFTSIVWMLYFSSFSTIQCYLLL